jgi:hypothetical protein
MMNLDHQLFTANASKQLNVSQTFMMTIFNRLERFFFFFQIKNDTPNEFDSLLFFIFLYIRILMVFFLFVKKNQEQFL